MADTDPTPAKSPAFRFYPGDFLSDPNVIAMSLAERGAYITLICLCWKSPIPDDTSRLARLCNTSLSAFQKLWPMLSHCFRPDPQTPGFLIHPRLERERTKQIAFKDLRSASGKAGAAKRWSRDSTAMPLPSKNNSTAMPLPMAKDSSSLSSSLSSSDQDQELRENAARSPRARALQTGGVMAGTLPRDHMNCRQPCIRVCLTEKQHAILKARHGGDDAALDAFYAEVRSRLSPEVPIGDKPWQFWESQFAAKFGSVTSVNTRTAGNAAAIARFIAKGKP